MILRPSHSKPSSISPLVGVLVIGSAILIGLGAARGEPAPQPPANVHGWLCEQLEPFVSAAHESGDRTVAQQLELWARPRDPQRNYYFLPGSCAADWDEWSAHAPPSIRQRLAQLRVEYAQRLFQSAQEQRDTPQAADVYRQLHEVLSFNPRHEHAARILNVRRAARGATRRANDIQARRGRTRVTQLTWPPGSYWTIESEHFLVLTDADRQQGIQVAELLERFHFVWRQAFFEYWSSPETLRRIWASGSLHDPLPRRLRVVMFRDRSQYRGLLQSVEPQAVETLGYYHAASRTSYFYLDTAPQTRSWLHEVTHQLLHEVGRARTQIAQRQNFWLVEGLALYMESYADYGPFVTLGGIDATRLQYARYRAVCERFYVPLGQFTQLGQADLQQHSDIRRLYSQSAGLVHFLIHGRQGAYRGALIDYLKSVYSGRDTQNTLAQCAGVSYEELDREYRDFLNVRDQDLQGIEPRTAPEALALGHTAVTDEGFRAVEHLGQLTWLDLSWTGVTDAGLQRLEHATQLRQLSLEGTAVGDVTVRKLGQARQLEELDLSRTHITDASLPTLGQLEHLTALWLSHTAITDVGAADLGRLMQLKTLDLAGTQVSSATRDELSRSLPHLD